MIAARRQGLRLSNSKSSPLRLSDDWTIFEPYPIAGTHHFPGASHG